MKQEKLAASNKTEALQKDANPIQTPKSSQTTDD